MESVAAGRSVNALTANASRTLPAKNAGSIPGLKQNQRRQKKDKPREPQPPVNLLELDVQSVCDYLEGASFWHTHIQRVYAAAGFEARYVEREEVHPIWQVRLKRTTGELDADPKRARRQLLRILQQRQAGRSIKDFSLLDRRGDKLTVVFIWELGVPGILVPNPAYDQGPDRLLAPWY